MALNIRRAPDVDTALAPEIIPRHPRKLDHLDGVRGVAAISVLAAHCVLVFGHMFFGYDSHVFRITDLAARLSVIVFFVLSGFLVTQSLFLNVRRNRGLSIKDYLVSRITRIYPPLFGAIALTILACGIAYLIGGSGWKDDFAGKLYFGWQDIPKTLVMDYGLLQANGPLWTLYIEFHCYLIAMCIAASIGKPRPVALTWLAIAAVLCAYWQSQDEAFVLLGLIWSVGAIAFAAVQGGAVAAFRVAGLVAAVATLYLWWTVPMARSVKLGPESAAAQILFSIAASAILFLCNWPRLPKSVTNTADFSYTLYVTHFPIVTLILLATYSWASVSAINSAAMAAFAAIAAVGIAHMIARYFEDQRRFKPLVRSFLDSF
jgi:peptidoglycan/LPS O-acetylase OafA/YrhL